MSVVGRGSDARRRTRQGETALAGDAPPRDPSRTMTDGERRARDHAFMVNVPVVVPQDTWRFICEREGVNPDETHPLQLKAQVDDLMQLNFGYTLAAESDAYESLLASAPEIRLEGRDEVVASLPEHQRVVYKIVEDYGQIRPKELYEEYEEQVGDPMTDRTVRNHLKKLAGYGLIEAEGRSRDRVYRVSSGTPVREA